MGKKIQFFGASAIFICLGLGGYLYHQIQQVPQMALKVKEGQLFTLPKKANSKTLATLLQKENFVENAQFLPWYLKLNPQENHLKAGTYSLENLHNVGDLLKRLNSGKEVQFQVQFLEGSRFVDWQKNLQKAQHLKRTLQGKTEAEIYQALQLPKDSPNQKLEGWFYPDTYSYTLNSSDLDLLKRASQRLQKSLQQAWASRAENLPLKNAYEMLILASIVEKETSDRAEQPMVASVFINRLRKGMKLQTDPTVIYGMGEKYQGNIQRKDLQTPTPYNTYVIEGLPPSPIAMVTDSALQAVAHPAESKNLYFVANGSGGHQFSQTLAQHNKAVREYVRWYRKNIQGKK